MTNAVGERHHFKSLVDMTLKEESDSLTRNKVCEVWKDLLQKGVKESGVANDPNVYPPWLDYDKFQEARKIVNNHLITLDFSTYSGLMLIIQMPLVLVTLVETGKSSSVPDLFHRYLDFGKYVRSWTKDDIFDRDSWGHKNIMSVRAMHSRWFKEMERVEKPDRADMWNSQFGMVLAQWAFVGLAFLFPEKCGLHGRDRRKVVQAINTVWRAIGYSVGIKDEYNLCRESLDETLEYCRVWYHECYFPVFNSNHVAPVAHDMAMDIAVSLKSLDFPSGKVLMSYWMKEWGIDHSIKLSKKESFMFSVITWALKHPVKLQCFRTFVRNRMDRKFEDINRKREEIYKNLQKEHPEIKYTRDSRGKSECPFAGSFLPN